MNSFNNIPMPLKYVDPKGRVWQPYDVQYTSEDGTYSVYLYAISEEHAELQLYALKETGKVTGCVEAIYPEKD